MFFCHQLTGGFFHYHNKINIYRKKGNNVFRWALIPLFFIVISDLRIANCADMSTFLC
ncbi:hypothetical protein PROPEN_00170 [Proteus penneri ATCC 35198]|nr:hypothetical protein PROPEN_00170 [Proteus penneri ATCC 35198]